MSRTLVRGRFAPSPSGEIHLGNAWAALMSWLQVRQNRGTYILRIEDLDPERSKEEYVSALLRDLAWLGLDWDEGPDPWEKHLSIHYRQSRRSEAYGRALQNLIDKGLVYPCFCTRADVRNAANAPHGKILEYGGTCRGLNLSERGEPLLGKVKHSLRFRTPDEQVVFEDMVYGLQQINPYRELGDFILRRSDGVYSYQLAVVVDDVEMKISHVLRGADLLPSTGRQILIYKALGYAIPDFAHIPLLQGLDGNRLSKRHGAISLRHFREHGVKAERLVGMLGFWAGLLTKPEPVKATELISHFDLKKIPLENITVDPNRLF